MHRFGAVSAFVSAWRQALYLALNRVLFKHSVFRFIRVRGVLVAASAAIIRLYFRRRLWRLRGYLGALSIAFPILFSSDRL